MPQNSVDELFQRAKERHRARDLTGAEAIYQQILAINPAHSVALNLTGVLNASRGELSEAIGYFRDAIQSQPYYAEAHFNLGKALQDAERFVEAAEAYRQAAACRPGYAKALDNLGVVLQKLGQLEQALLAYESAMRAQAQFPETHFNRGTLLEQLMRVPEAIAAYRTAVLQKPEYADALINLGNALQKMGQFDEAIQTLELALTLKPRSATAVNALANALKETGRMDEAMGCYRRVVELGGNHWAVGNYLYSSHFHPSWDARRIRVEHDEWNERFAAPLMPVPTPHLRTSNRLRVGFVSPDLHEHPVGRFMLPLAENLDRSRFEISYFSDSPLADSIASGIRASADHWHETSRLTDTELAERVRAEKLDVLIDLTMHMQGSRLLTFARKPAPLQITYLAYCSTTGLTAIDYRISDPYLDPIGMDESVYSEKTLRLPHTYWCYRPPGDAMQIAQKQTDQIVFGCLNNYCKVTNATWDAWIQVLQSVPKSRLLVFCPEGSHRATAFERLKHAGVDPDRLSMIARMSRSHYFETYDRIDIGLDPFPYGGGTTTLDALWTGVPVVSLAGQTAVGRGGVSILSNLGMPRWIAGDVSEYVRAAGEIADNRFDRLALREQLRSSPLMDEQRFAREFEDAIAHAWRDLTGDVV